MVIIFKKFDHIENESIENNHQKKTFKNQIKFFFSVVVFKKATEWMMET